MAFTRRLFLKRAGLGLGGLAATAGGLSALRPGEATGAMPPYFANLDRALKNERLYEPVILIDLDRLDYNISVTKKHFSPTISYRLSAKSLPSANLQTYVMDRMGSQRLMAFHVPYLEQYLAYGPDIDILMGKPVLTGSIRNFFTNLTSTSHTNAADRIQWLADDATRVGNLLALARDQNLTLQINIEIDIGLHRGGARNNAELAAMLNLVQDNPQYLTFTGFMGYEGHVAAAPAPLFSIDKSFDDAMRAYQSFYEFGVAEFAQLFQADITLNSGGSKTYQRFGDHPFVNDIAAGSCMVKPSTFDILDDHLPALFIATPVLKKNDGLTIPFLEDQSRLVSWWNPNAAKSWHVYGGGWAADMVAPEGVSIFEMMADPPNQNLMPNQSLYTGPASTHLNEGDFIFMQPQQGDAMFQFEKIALIRDGKVSGYWDSFDRKL